MSELDNRHELFSKLVHVRVLNGSKDPESDFGRVGRVVAWLIGCAIAIAFCIL